MAIRVDEVMNREVLSFEPDAPASLALDLMLASGVTAAPVVDAREHPIGVASIRQLVRARAGASVASYVRAPAILATCDMTLLDAARLLDEADVHHLAVVDERGGLAGFVSSLDLLRGITGAPARHPETFVHWDADAQLAFSNDRVLDAEHIGDAPHAPGLVVLGRGGAGRPERVAWVEETLDIKGWLIASFSAPMEHAQRSGQPQPGAALRYRYAEITDPLEREQLAFRLREQAQHAVNEDASSR